MSPFIAVALSGIAATFVMTVVMYLVHWSTKMAHGDMIRSIGSFATRTMENSLKVGAIVHIIAGIIFAFLYYKLFTILDLNTQHQRLIGGALMGLAHGFVVSFILVILVAEHHPMERFRRVGFPVALLYSVGHIFYGLILGLMFNAFNMPPASEAKPQTELGHHIDGTILPGLEVDLAVHERELIA